MTHPRVGTFVVLLLAAFALPLRAAAAEEVDLSKAEGIDRFPGGEAERALLHRNGFVVLPRFEKQIFSHYIGGTLPYYVTTDSAHRTYHVLFEAALKEVEGGVARKVRTFLEGLHQRLAATSPTSGGPSADGRALAIAHVAVAARLLGAEVAVPPRLEALVAAEVALVTGAGGMARSPLFDVDEDYALYLPRGFYAGDPALEAYFRAVTWLGRRGLRTQDERETWAALHLVLEVQADEALRTALGDVSSFLDWMVGPADDLTVAEYDATLDATLGADRSEAVLATRFEDVRKALGALRAPEVNAQLLQPDEWKRFREETKGLRILPSRRTPDAWLLQTLGELDPEPGLPTGLEVALALGSERAGVHRRASGERGTRRAALVESAAPAFLQRLDGTHYGATLRAAALLYDRSAPLCGGGSAVTGAKGTPVFTPSIYGSGAWNDRLLTSGLSGWTSLRHAWALHAKVTMFALGMTQDPVGVVEPAPRYYAALAGLARSLVERADAIGGFGGDPRAALRKLLPLFEMVASGDIPMDAMQHLQAAYEILEASGEALEELMEAQGHADLGPWAMQATPRLKAWLEGEGKLDAGEQAFVDGLGASAVRAKLQQLAELLDDLERISEVELRGEVLSSEDAELVKEYGKLIAALNFYGGNAWLEPQEQMGLVATVASDPRTRSYLESGVGAAMELYVALPLSGGGRQLYQGGVYAWYEFASPKPTTDAEWLERVANRQTPPLPPFTASYVPAPDAKGLVARVRAGEHVEELQDVSAPEIGAALLEHLEQGKHETGKEDHHLAWVAMALVPYATSELRPRIKEALFHWVANAKDDVHPGNEHEALGEAAAVALSKVVRPEDYPRVLALLRDRPAHAPKTLGERVVIVLELTSDPEVAAKADTLIRDDDPLVRRVGLEVRVRMRYRGVGTRADLVEAVMAYLALTEDEERRYDAIHYLDYAFDGAGEHVRKEHIEVLSPLMQSDNPQTAGRAIGLWGYAIGSLPDDHPHVPEAIEWLGKRYAGGPRYVSLGCIDALAAIGGPLALKALMEIMRNPGRESDAGYFVAGALGRMGEEALPHLFRLCFDETETGSSVNAHELRVCDEAAKAVDRILGGRYHYDESLGYPEKRVPALEAIRAEARKRGYGP